MIIVITSQLRQIAAALERGDQKEAINLVHELREHIDESGLHVSSGVSKFVWYSNTVKPEKEGRYPVHYKNTYTMYEYAKVWQNEVGWRYEWITTETAVVRPHFTWFNLPEAPPHNCPSCGIVLHSGFEHAHWCGDEKAAAEFRKHTEQS